jgi:hypothetical protein
MGKITNSDEINEAVALSIEVDSNRNILKNALMNY